MKIVVDADACPVVDITVRTGKKYNIPVTLVCDSSHYISRDDCSVVVVSKGADSADFVIVNMLKKGDIAVTQDYGLAAMCLSKEAYAINQRGFLYTAENIDGLLLRRHMGKEARRRGERGAKIPKRKKDEDLSFEKTLCELIEKICK